MKVGLLGAGRIGVLHARVLASLDGVETLIIGDADAARAAAATDVHAGLIRAGIARGSPVFCEKPPAPTPQASIAVARQIDAGYRERRRLIEEEATHAGVTHADG